MKSIVSSVSLLGCVAVGLAAAGCVVGTDPTTEEATPSTTRAAAPSRGSSDVEQTRIAQSTLKLENQFSDQFTKGQIDRAALQGPIDEVIQAMPEAARPKVQQHIAEVLDKGEKLASQLTPEQRAAATTPPSSEDPGAKPHIDVITGWGWPGAAGWGGYGAFAFPGMYYGGLGYGGYNPAGYNPPGYNPYTGNAPGYNPPGAGYGYGAYGGYPGYGYGYGSGYGPYSYGYSYPFGSAYGSSYSSGYSTATSYATGYSTGYGTGYGCGFGYGGCYGLGATGWY
jgi:hypothetical protein